MTLLTLQDVAYGHGAELLLNGVTFAIEENDRVSLIGRNGAGKSTLMNILMGEYELDGGSIIRKQNLKCAFLPQAVPRDLEGSVYDNVAKGLGEVGEILIRAEYCSKQVEIDPSDKNLNALEKAQSKIEDKNLWETERFLHQLLEKMELDPEDEVKGFSAGLKRRVLLGRAVVSRPEFLMLDEPTNHLDIPSIQWLENFLDKFDGALLFVSHDRQFLRSLSKRALIVERGKCETFKGNYDASLELWAEHQRVVEIEEKQFDKRLAEEEVWIRQGIKARRTRNEGRVRALEGMRSERQGRSQKMGQVNFRVQDGEKSGHKVIEVKKLSYAWGEQTMFTDLNLLIERGDKLAIVGANGCGKTTLLNLLLGKLEPQTGTVVQGTNLTTAFFDQLHAALDPRKTVRENLADGSDYVEMGGRRQHVMGYLQNFLFSPQRAQSPVQHLSGGERNRLQLAKMFTQPGNLLVLDEPTNDLDAETLDLLVEMLIDFAGTVLLVSHDRDFIDRVATSTLVFQDNQVSEYIGGYSDYLRQKEILDKGGSLSDTTALDEAIKPEKISLLDTEERKELFNLPKHIEQNEQKQAKVHEKMAKDGFYDGTPKQVEKVMDQLKKLEDDGTALFERWEFLEQKQDG
jgi:ATP-binding cassette subfamily F protein uup